MSFAQYLFKRINQKSVGMLIVLLVVTLSYVNTFSNAFVWDDFDTIVNWQATRTWASIPTMLAGATPPGHPGNYRPVRNVLYVVSYMLWGQNPWGYHLQAIILAVLMALLVYVITEKLVKRPFAPLITALLFGVHPMHVEAFTWITSSMDMFGIVFGFGAVAAFLSWRDRPSHWGWYVLTWVLTLLAAFSNEIALTVPMLLTAIILLIPRYRVRRPVVTMTPLYIPLIVNVFVRAALLHIGARYIYIGNSFWKTMLIMGKALVLYLRLLVFPVGLTIDHSLGGGLTSWAVELTNPGSRGEHAVTLLSVSDPMVLLALATLLTIIIMFFVYRKRNPIISLGIAWFGIGMLPVSNLIPTEAMMTERYALFASFGFCLIVGYVLTKTAILTKIQMRSSQLLWVTFILIIGSFSILTIMRNEDWANNKTLFASAVARNPDAYVSRLQLATVYIGEGNMQAALDQYLIVSKIIPQEPQVDIYIATMYSVMQKYPESVIYFNRALKKDPWDIESYYRLGNMMKTLKRYDEAIDVYTTGIKLAPNHIAMINNLGVVYSIEGKYAQAHELFERALTINPSYESARENLLHLKERN